jgi:hypothetical protein
VSLFDAFGLTLVKKKVVTLGVHMILLCVGDFGQCERDSQVRRDLLCMHL